MNLTRSRIAAVLAMTLLFLLGCSKTADAQICGPAQINYVIRDGKGRIIDPRTLKPSNFVNEKGEFWKREPGEVGLHVPDKKDIKARSITYWGGASCVLKLDEVTIQIGKTKMRLLFDLSLNSYNDSAHCRKVIDSLPFAQGTFRLEPTTENEIAATKWKKVVEAPPLRTMIGNLKDESVQDDCGCGFGPLKKTNTLPALLFATDAAQSSGWLNIDGEDVKLTLTHSTAPKVERIGSRLTTTYVAPGINVFIVYIVNRLCIPYSPQCETTGYRITITVRKDGRKETVRGIGQCGCT